MSGGAYRCYQYRTGSLRLQDDNENDNEISLRLCTHRGYDFKTISIA